VGESVIRESHFDIYPQIKALRSKDMVELPVDTALKVTIIPEKPKRFFLGILYDWRDLSLFMVLRSHLFALYVIIKIHLVSDRAMGLSKEAYTVSHLAAGLLESKVYRMHSWQVEEAMMVITIKVAI